MFCSAIFPILDGTSVVLFLSALTLSLAVVNKILSHMCGRLYFPMFPLRVGLVTLMKMDFLWFWQYGALPAHNIEAIHQCAMAYSRLRSYLGEGASMHFLNLFPKVLPHSPVYCASQSNLLCQF